MNVRVVSWRSSIIPETCPNNDVVFAGASVAAGKGPYDACINNLSISITYIFCLYIKVHYWLEKSRHLYKPFLGIPPWRC